MNEWERERRRKASRKDRKKRERKGERGEGCTVELPMEKRNTGRKEKARKENLREKQRGVQVVRDGCHIRFQSLWKEALLHAFWAGVMAGAKRNFLTHSCFFSVVMVFFLWWCVGIVRGVLCVSPRQRLGFFRQAATAESPWCCQWESSRHEHHPSWVHSLF